MGDDLKRKRSPIIVGKTAASPLLGDLEMTAIEAPPLERRLVAILAADVEGYSRLMHDDEERTLTTLTSHRAIIDGLIAAGRGEISGTAGDSVLAEFASVVDAVRCSVAIQQELQRANQPFAPEARMSLRIGVNVGDVMVKDGGIFGDGVNVAARLEAIATPGGICVTRGVRDHLRDRSDYRFEDLGEHVVKNIARPVRVFSVIFDTEGTTTFLPSDGAPRPPEESTAAPEASLDPAELVFWETIQETDTPAEYEAYLQQYPQGEFAILAKTRLENFAETANAPTEVDNTIELAFWASVERGGTATLYNAYLQKYPEGEFRLLAEAQLTELTKS